MTQPNFCQYKGNHLIKNDQIQYLKTFSSGRLALAKSFFTFITNWLPLINALRFCLLVQETNSTKACASFSLIYKRSSALTNQSEDFEGNWTNAVVCSCSIHSNLFEIGLSRNFLRTTNKSKAASSSQCDQTLQFVVLLGSRQNFQKSIELANSNTFCSISIVSF